MLPASLMQYYGDVKIQLVVKTLYVEMSPELCNEPLVFKQRSHATLSEIVFLLHFPGLFTVF